MRGWRGWILMLGVAFCSGVMPGQTSAAPTTVPGNGVSAPVLIYGPEAPWPTDAKGKNIVLPGMKKGLFHRPKALDVNVRAVVDRDGSIKEAEILKPNLPEFDANALEAVKTYRFKPSMKDGKPVAVRIIIEVGFTVY